MSTVLKADRRDRHHRARTQPHGGGGESKRLCSGRHTLEIKESFNQHSVLKWKFSGFHLCLISLAFCPIVTLKPGFDHAPTEVWSAWALGLKGHFIGYWGGGVFLYVNSGVPHEKTTLWTQKQKVRICMCECTRMCHVIGGSVACDDLTSSN